MQNPFAWLALSLSAGVLAAPLLSSAAAVPAAAGCFLAGMAFAWCVRGRPVFLPLLALCLFALGVLAAKAAPGPDGARAADLSGPERLRLSGKVDSWPELRRNAPGRPCRFILATAERGRVQVSAY
jgi:hypothetical protein